MYKLAILFALCASLCAPTLRAITFSFGLDLNNLNQQSQTISGVTLTVDNPVQTGTVIEPGFISTNDGILVTSVETVNAISSFQFTFDTDVYITSYAIGDVLNGGGTFSLSISGGSSINNLEAIAVNSYDLDTPLLVSQGSVVTFTAVNFGTAGTANFASISAEQVPEPAQTAFLVGIGTGLFALGFRRYRRNKSC
ncbi:MAG: hypothetical protein ACQKBW_09685 [Puniceicoccales bacterium]